MGKGPWSCTCYATADGTGLPTYLLSQGRFEDPVRPCQLVKTSLGLVLNLRAVVTTFQWSSLLD